MVDQTPQQQIQAQIEREVRHLIGDLHLQVITLNTVLAMSQTPTQPTAAATAGAGAASAASSPAGAEDGGQAGDRPDKRAANGGRHPREVAS